ncbi:tripartite tricarboxylate transporter substrate binding protein [Phytoactinopolyspora halophila]|uniref:tripartite tricarboxylate transporter substrate binding protein n=1 Tax=Phytoactinopolyspora halophila TaxID=1981511 RepID=UPI0013142FE7|nr:tripartite tricarboxylate transporter substrate binding protein [Phytoactinopolyspora halophila]
MKRAIMAMPLFALLVTACSESGSEDSALDCGAFEFIIPYAPGGGSDQQFRRLQESLEESLGASINPVYMEGADGALGWKNLADAEPDGCTVGNVVSPNIMELTILGEEVGFHGMEDFEYIAWTETTPNAVAVAQDSPYETIDDYIQEAEANPGDLTIAGVGDTIAIGEILAGTGVDLSYVPVSGGVGSIVPQLQGGHVDAAIFGARHVMQHQDQMRALAITGSESSPVLEDVPTFEEAGYDGINLTSSWGIAGPAGMPDEAIAEWNEAILTAMDDEAVHDALLEEALTPLEQDVDEALAFSEELFEAAEDAAPHADEIEQLDEE